MNPDYKGIYRTFLVTIPLVVLAIIANSKIEGARYLYLTLNVPILPKNQIIRVIILSILAIGIYHLMYLVFYRIKDNSKR